MFYAREDPLVCSVQILHSSFVREKFVGSPRFVGGVNKTWVEYVSSVAGLGTKNVRAFVRRASPPVKDKGPPRPKIA